MKKTLISLTRWVVCLGTAGLLLSLTAWLAHADENHPQAVPDPRHLSNGQNIPSEGYADQPYVVKTDDGAWLCVMTTGKGIEGEKGQHVIALRSHDQGHTWDKPVDIEPADGPEASYAVLLKVPGGRIYCFYNHNTDRISEVKREDGKVYQRVDSLGHYVFKYSDDGGLTWSGRRYEVPIREFACDRNNVYAGKLRFFWNVGRPLILKDSVVGVLHKVGAMGEGFFAQSEGAFWKSPNLLTERDPEKITFETLPDGDTGLRAPPGGGRVAEEQSIVPLGDGSLYCVYRTTDGWPACSYSRDGGHVWTPPDYARYSPGGQRFKHPRAANFVWRCDNGKYLYWFHNHGGAPLAAGIKKSPRQYSPYNDRNPVWLVAGVERDAPGGRVICWSQPEILLYEDDPYIRMSYPDLVEDGGKYYVTETQKTIGRVHEIPAALVEGLFNQFECRNVATNGLLLDLSAGRPLPKVVPMPRLPDLNRSANNQTDNHSQDLRAGFSFDFWVRFDSLAPGQIVLDSRNEAGEGILVSTTETGTIKLFVQDGRSESAWECDRGVLAVGRRQHVVITLDGGPKIITFIVNGVLCDGGNQRQFGWGRFSPNLRTPHGSDQLRLAPNIQGAMESLRIYGRALRTSEAVGNYHQGGLN